MDQHFRVHYAEDIQKHLHTDEDDKRLFEGLKINLKKIQEHLELGQVAARHLEVSLINTACDYPGASIAEKLVLPLLQERLEEGARQLAEEKARQAQEEIMALLEVRCEGLSSIVGVLWISVTIQVCMCDLEACVKSYA